MCGDTFGCHNLGSATWWLEVRSDVKHYAYPTMHIGQSPMTKNYQVQTVNSTELENPWLVYVSIGMFLREKLLGKLRLA